MSLICIALLFTQGYKLVKHEQIKSERFSKIINKQIDC